MRVESASESDFSATLVLYRANLTPAQAQRSGFIQVDYPEWLLRAMMSLEPLLVAKDGTTLAGYFTRFRTTTDTSSQPFERGLMHQGKKLSEHRFMKS